MKKIADLPREKRCQDPCHNPPSMWCPREPGIYEHECPTCGAKSKVIYDPPTLGVVPKFDSFGKKLSGWLGGSWFDHKSNRSWFHKE